MCTQRVKKVFPTLGDIVGMDGNGRKERQLELQSPFIFKQMD